MKLDTVQIPGSSMEGIAYSRKMVIHEYPWLDVNAVSEMGLGVTQVKVSCKTTTVAEREALEAKCRQTGTKLLYYPSVAGSEDLDDRYYIVYTSPIRWTPTRSMTVYQGEFDCFAADPLPYDSATGAHLYA